MDIHNFGGGQHFGDHASIFWWTYKMYIGHHTVACNKHILLLYAYLHAGEWYLFLLYNLYDLLVSAYHTVKLCYYYQVRHLNNSALEKGIIFQPGIGPEESQHEEIKRHAYYQWVPFVLFGQALLFYMPHFLWKSIEGKQFIEML